MRARIYAHTVTFLVGFMLLQEEREKRLERRQCREHGGQQTSLQGDHSRELKGVRHCSGGDKQEQEHGACSFIFFSLPV